MSLDLRYISRTLSQIEDQIPSSQAALRSAYARACPIPVIGLTGPPGAGKSTLIDHLAAEWAEAGESVAVLAVDPSSPFTGGAVLGDRFRMQRASAHPNVFLRSVSCRGLTGGISRSLFDMVVALGTLGFDRILIETVGSGQTDLDIATLADCIVVISVPGLGDDIQASKAGILEIGDIHVVNKSDAPGADLVVGHLQANLNLVYSGTVGVNEPRESSAPERRAPSPAVRERHGPFEEGGSYWRPPLHRMCARDGTGVGPLTRDCDAFLAWRRRSGRDAIWREERIRQHILRTAVGRLLDLVEDARFEAVLHELAEELGAGRVTPAEAAARLLAHFARSLTPTP